MLTRSALVLGALALCTLVAADCPGACSGHGDCKTNNDFCDCYLGWMGNDCSQQLCPYALSYIDTPNGDIDGDNNQAGGGMDSTQLPSGSDGAINPMYRPFGTWERHPSQLYGAIGDATYFPTVANEGHFYAECSNRGICDRSTGICSCFTSYEGTACNRTTCVNSCSGHGICETINEATPVNKHYRLWDAEKTRMCKCDGGYFGVDCSQKKCMKNDDPLTTMTSHQFYSSGLLEAGEVQQVDVRCPYNGVMNGPAYVTLTYTDVQFGDVYETPMFDILTASGAQIRDLLRALPNQVLATYDGSFNKLSGVVKTAVNANNFYRLTVTFDEHLGDVPLLSGTAYFKCLGGAEVLSNKENVKVTYIGDGPAYDLSFVFSAFSATGASYVVRNASGFKTTGDETTAATAHTFDTALASETLTGAAAWTREATKVQFAWGLKASSHASETMTINVKVNPIVSAQNVMYTLQAAGTSRTYTTAGTAHTATLDDTAVGAAPAIDFIVRAVMVSSTVARLYINGEVYGLVTIGGALVAATLETAPATWTTPASFGSLGAAQLAYVDDLDLRCASCVAADAVWFYFPKDPYASASYYVSAGVPSANYFSAGAIEDIWPSFNGFQAPLGPVTLVLQVTKVDSAADEYRWKLAGDTYWSTTTVSFNSATGALTTVEDASGGNPIPAGTNNALDNIASFLTMYPDDPVRQSIAPVRLSWLSGVDNQKRVCNKEAATYYLQFGSNGRNDSPECSDRGVCDYSTGICKCFKGYAGIDCTTQNALSMGGSGATVA